MHIRVDVPPIPFRSGWERYKYAFLASRGAWLRIGLGAVIGALCAMIVANGHDPLSFGDATAFGLGMWAIFGLGMSMVALGFIDERIYYTWRDQQRAAGGAIDRATAKLLERTWLFQSPLRFQTPTTFAIDIGQAKAFVVETAEVHFEQLNAPGDTTPVLRVHETWDNLPSTYTYKQWRRQATPRDIRVIAQTYVVLTPSLSVSELVTASTR